MDCLRGSRINQIEIADDFYGAYEHCFCPHEGQIRAIPGFVNGLFAAELYFKLLLGEKAETLKGCRGHNLLFLYNLLESSAKSSLGSVAATGGHKLEELLKIIGDGFIAWRYIFEGKKKKFGGKWPFEYTEAFLDCYLPKLKEMAHEKMGH